MATVLFMGASSTGKTTHIAMLDRGLQRLGGSAGRLRASYYLAARLIVNETCPRETDLTLSITVRSLTYEVQSRRVELAAVDYDGHSHIGAASFLNIVSKLPAGEVGNVTREASRLSRSLLGSRPLDGRSFLESYTTILSTEMDSRRLADVYWEKLARSLGVRVEDYPADRINVEFMRILRGFEKVDASAASIAANLAAARVLEAEGKRIEARVIADPEACIYSEPSTLSSILEGHLHTAPSNALLGVEPGEDARNFYLDFLTGRLAVTGVLLGSLLLGFHALEGDDSLTLNILHPADMAAYSITYARKQAYIDVASGALRLDPSWQEALEKITPIVEEASLDPRPDKLRLAAREVDRVRRKATIRLEPAGKSLSAFPVNAAKVLGAIPEDFASRVTSSLLVKVQSHSEAQGILEALGDWAVRLARSLERLESSGRKEARELAAAVRGLLPVKLLIRYSINATFYTHALMVSSLLAAVDKAIRAGVVDPHRLRLLTTLSYLDTLVAQGMEPQKAYAKAKACVSTRKACREVASYSLQNAMAHDTANRLESGELFGRGWYVIPGGFAGDEGRGENAAFALAIACLEILPAIYGLAASKLEACKKIEGASRVEVGRDGAGL